MKSRILLLTTLLLIAGCATYTGWEPVTDSHNDPNAANIPRDTEECKMMAAQAGSPGTEAAKGAAAGGLLGFLGCMLPAGVLMLLCRKS